MEYTGCKNAAIELIDEASDKFGDAYFINEEKYESLDEVCSLIDELAQGVDCQEVRVRVDTTTKELIFIVVCDEIIIEHEMKENFAALAGLISSMRFSTPKVDSLRMEFCIYGLWLGGYRYE